ncbi:trafficking protein particle complex subunit 10 isoform X2 [Metopolophium dirhodum]|uniref:trafficking protein particle complex subunit 10 isoform X2 n=1 Tax=Metopolophium dirhodum TaxID=44670 RepID=UPI00298F5708|nr:trafficking protein particle complex subunit 10 isoform X2 [Metopolophium dirhodum]
MSTANPIGDDALRISDHKPLITYAGDKELFENLKLVLSQSLSQEPIEWRRQYGRPMKMVTLSTDFVPFNKDAVAEQIGSRNLVGRPIMHTFWTQCLDMEVYKSLLRDEIDKWMNEMNKHNIIDWVIVVVETYDLRKHSKLLPRTTVFDKIKSDFAEKKADRCLSVINPPKSEVRCGSSAWRALITNVRLLILSAFDRLFLKYEDNIRNYREQRNDPSWSFCKYFLYQEELAFALEMLGIHDEALVQYDELDAMFTQFILNSQVGNVPQWLTEFQVVLEWWSAVLFMKNISRKQREAIKIRKLSLLEFRCYLFSRQASLLMAASKPWIVAERALIFLHQAVSDLKTLEIECPQGSVACWVLQCCAQILVICQSVKKPEHLEECSHHTAPLLYYSLKKLYELGDLCGLLPGSVQTSEQLHIVQVLCGGMQSGHDLTTATESVATLKTALSSSETFSKHYLDIAELAISTYKHNKLMRCAHSLVGLELAKFYTLSGDTTKRTMFLVKALKLFEQDNWKLLIVQTNLELVKCFKKIGNVDQFVKTCLQLASSVECNIKVRQDHFDQMSRMIQDSNIECIYPTDDVIVLAQIDVKCNNEESNYPSTVSLKFKSNLPKTVLCPKIAISVVIGSALKKMKSKLSLVKSTYSYDINKGNILPMTYNHNYQQDGHFASTGITCLNQKSYLRRQDSQRRKPSMNYNKNDYHDIISANNVNIQPGMNSIDLTLNCLKNGETIGYLWEINLSSTDIKTIGPLAESLKLNFQTKYSSAEKPDCTQDLNFEFTINNYKTLLLIESGVEMAGKSGEFCRMNTVCTYTAHFKRSEHSEHLNIPQSEISFKYEIVADKTMWAVCGRGSDVITFPPNSISQTVSVEVMPLMSGFLPIPTLNVFRYFPSNSRQNIESKLEQFSTGQVYDASKGVQTHVLPRITADTS